MANDGHVPDIIHKNAADNGMHELFESKVYTATKTSNNMGGGTAKCGGSPLTAADALLVSFGCTKEKLIVDRTSAAVRAGSRRTCRTRSSREIRSASSFPRHMERTVRTSRRSMDFFQK